MRHFEDLDLALYSKITKFETDADKQKQIIDVVFFAMEAVAEKLQSQVEQQAAQTTMQPEIKTLQVENKCLSDSCREVTIKYRDTKFHLSEAVKNYADIFNQLSAANQRIQELLDLVEVVERRNKQLEERIRVADAEEPTAYIAWLFERNSMWGVEWYAAEGMDSSWTKNADKAIKFPSKESLLEICEHRWEGRKLPFTLEGGGDWEYNYYAAEHMFNCGIAPDLHAQIPAEVELKGKIAELEAIIKEQP